MANEENHGEDWHQLEVTFLRGHRLTDFVDVGVSFLFGFKVLEESRNFKLGWSPIIYHFVEPGQFKYLD